MQAEKPKKKQDDEDDNVVLVDIEETKESDKPKATKVIMKELQESDINYEALKPVENPAGPKRISWVPHQGGLPNKFDYEKEKEHFVGIGEEYKPPPEHKPGVSNFKPLEMSEQQVPRERLRKR